MTELIFGVFMLALCVVIYIVAGNYPTMPISQGGGAAFYPRFLAVVLFVLMILYLIENRAKISAALKKKRTEPFRVVILRSRYLLCFVGVLVLIPILLPVFGFIPTSIFTIFISSLVLRWKDGAISRKGLLGSLLVAVVMTAVIYVIFEVVFIIPLPKGKLF